MIGRPSPWPSNTCPVTGSIRNLLATTLLLVACGSSVGEEPSPPITSTPSATLSPSTPAPAPTATVLTDEPENRCEGVDNDGDGQVDEGYDQDGDNSWSSERCPWDQEGVKPDCNDRNSQIHPGADEHCDGLDEDCDMEVDEDAVDSQSYCRDEDGDPYGGGSPVQLCEPTTHYIKCGDCDEEDPKTYLGAPELCDEKDNDCDGHPEDKDSESFKPETECNKKDDDCDGLIDEGLDEDEDGYPGHICTNTSPGSGLDCDDNNPHIYPFAVEVCNELDDDCDGAIDDSGVGGGPWYYDDDGDGYGSMSSGQSDACEMPVNYVTMNGDCDDHNADIGPGFPEICDGYDNDCDQMIDEDFDDDGDAFSDTLDCAGTVPEGTLLDCDDEAPGIHPYALERCDGIDENCNDIVDDPDDTDGDGYPVCPMDGVLGDCDDLRVDVYPGAPEVLGDGIDHNCDGICDADFVVCRDSNRVPGGILTTTTIQDAITLAVDGDVITVCPGRYKESINFLGKTLSLRGLSRSVNTELSPHLYQRGVTLDSGEGTGTLLGNFTIQGGGQARSDVLEGGGILVSGSSLIVENSVITGFYILQELEKSTTCVEPDSREWASTWGAGLYIEGASEVLIQNTTFSTNRAQHGGAISILGGHLSVIDSQFTSNTAVQQICEGYTPVGSCYGETGTRTTTYQSGEGGALYISGDVDVGVQRVTLNENHSILGGAIYFQGRILTVETSEFAGNSAYDPTREIVSPSCQVNTLYGGAGGAIYAFNTVEVSNTTFSENRAMRGGDIASINTALTLQNVLMMNSTALELSESDQQLGQDFWTSSQQWLGQGSGLWQKSGSLSAHGLHVVGGTTLQGGGLYLEGVQTVISTLQIEDMQVFDKSFSWETQDVGSSHNTAEFLGQGAGIYVDGGKFEADQVTITDGTTLQGGGLYLKDVDSSISHLWIQSMYVGGISHHAVYGYIHGVSEETEYQGEGAGIYVEGGNLTLSQFAITDAHADIQGGGLTFLPPGGSLVLQAGAIVGCSAPQGAGLYVDSGPDSSDDIRGVSVSYSRGGEGLAIKYLSPGALSYSNFYDNEGGDITSTEPFESTEMIYGPPSFMSVDPVGDPALWDLHLIPEAACRDTGPDTWLDPDGSRADIGPYGGLSADSWDLDGDGYPQAWAPGSTNASPGYDCNDQDPNMFPGQGCL